MFDESTQESIIKAFADVSGVPEESVKCSITDAEGNKKIALQSTSTDANGETTTNLTITDLGKSEYNFTAKVENPLRSLNVDSKKIITSSPQQLPAMVKQVLVMCRVTRHKNQNLLKKIRSYV
jgi:5-hydroxyisourate hydrolase-like protein (transthyretin family)